MNYLGLGRRQIIYLIVVLILGIIMSCSYAVYAVQENNSIPKEKITYTTVAKAKKKTNITVTEKSELQIEKQTFPKATRQKTTKQVPTTELETTEPTELEDFLTEEVSETTYEWTGEVLTESAGRIEGPSGEETYYNLDMFGCISIMYDLGYEYDYYVREDGVKMFGSYVMCAADLNIRPKGTLVDTSLGKGIVVDTGDFASENPTQLDIAVAW